MTPELVAAGERFIVNVGILGALILIFGFVLYRVFTRLVWPFITKRVEAGDKERAERHQEYIGEVVKTRESEGATAKVLIMLEQRMENHETRTDQQFTDLRRTIDDKYDSILREVQVIRRQ